MGKCQHDPKIHMVSWYQYSKLHNLADNDGLELGDGRGTLGDTCGVVDGVCEPRCRKHSWYCLKDRLQCRSISWHRLHLMHAPRHQPHKVWSLCVFPSKISEMVVQVSCFFLSLQMHFFFIHIAGAYHPHRRRDCTAKDSNSFTCSYGKDPYKTFLLWS
jgi:hypothetical protein